jgi:hypothetical protein
MVRTLWVRAKVMDGNDTVEIDTDGMAEPDPALAARPAIEWIGSSFYRPPDLGLKPSPNCARVRGRGHGRSMATVFITSSNICSRPAIGPMN